jgi:hypothetical protein
MSEAVMRASLLQPWTDAGRAGFGVEFMGELGRLAGFSLDEIGQQNRRLAAALNRYGFNAEDWDAIRAFETEGWKEARYVSAERIMRDEVNRTTGEAIELPLERRVELTSKLLAMVDSEMDFAVPVPDARVRGMLTQGTRPGTIPGAFMRAGAMYKSFPMTMIVRHMMRAVYAGAPAQMGAYAASLLIGTTVMGTVAYQAKQIARGKNPMAWDDPKLWIAGVFQGGGTGIAGDFVQGSTSRHGKGPLSSFMGPVFGLGEDALNLTLVNLGISMEGKDPRLPLDAIKFLGRYTPGQSLWYTRVGFDRLVLDQLRLAVDPAGARRSFAATERFQMRRAGVAHWWRPGRTTPEGLPEIAQ